MNLDRNLCKTIKSKYKGGSGKMENLPVPFPIKHAQDQNVKGMREEGLPVPEEAEQDESESTPGGTEPPIRNNPLQDPAGLLRRLRSDEEESPMNLVTSGGPTATGGEAPKRPLIAEIDPSGNGKSTESTAAPMKSKGRASKKPAVEKGFLRKAKAPLYPEGSSEGGPKTFMDRCKVVDTREMTPEQYEEAMRQYAEGPSVPAVTNAANNVATSKKGVMKKRAPRDVKTASEPRDERDHADLEFNQLSERLDDDFARFAQNRVDPQEEARELESMFSTLWGNKPGVATRGSERKAEEPTPTPQAQPQPMGTGAVANGAREAEEPEHEVKVDGNSLHLRVQLPKLAGGMGEVELDISDTKAVLAVPNLYHLSLDLPCRVQSFNTVAKYRKKKRVLDITIPLLLSISG